MKAYLSFVKLRIAIGLQYRFAAIAGIATQFFWGAMMLMMYNAYYKAGIDTPMEWHELVSYIWLGQAFLMLTRFSFVDSEIHDSIVTGQVSYEFVRPLNIYYYWYSKLLASKVASTLLRFAPIIIISIFLPSHYRLMAPASMEAFILFLVTLFLGLFLSLGLTMLIYSLMFFTTSSRGIFSIYGVVADFFAGGVIPIPFMPGVLRTICYALPFRLIMDLPFRIYVGNISIAEGIESIIIQLVWTLIVILAGNIIMKNATKKLVVQGG